MRDNKQEIPVRDLALYMNNRMIQVKTSSRSIFLSDIWEQCLLHQ